MQHSTPRWHMMSADEAEQRLKTDRKEGLSPKIGHSRLLNFGRNDLFLPEPYSISYCIKRILSDVSLLLLALLCIVALFFDRVAISLAVLFVLALSCTISILAYVKTNRLKESLSAYATPRVHLLRGGQELLCDASMLVPGDVILLHPGDVIPCDARLIETGRRCTVEVYRADESGEITCVRLPKDAEVVYAKGETETALQWRNMVYAGSVMYQGEARAIVTETGDATLIAEEYGPHPLAMQVGEPSYMAPMRKYMNRYSIILCALILPVTIFGLFAGRGSLNIFDVFLLSLCLVVSSMSEQLLSMGRIVCAFGIMRAALSHGAPADRAIIKNYRALDSLGRMDELLLVGKEALSDGHLHPYAAYVADGLLVGHKLDHPAVSQLCETVYRYERGITESELIDTDHTAAREWATGVAELCALVAFDRASANIRTLSLSPIPTAPEWVEVSLRTPEDQPPRRFRIHRCTQPESLLRCNASNHGGRTLPLDDDGRQMLVDMFLHLKNQGTEVCAYVREERGYVIFEGILAFREAYAPALRDHRRHLEQGGVRVSLFLPEEGNCYINDLLTAGWIESEEEVLLASQLSGTGMVFSEMFEKKRVFLGFPEGPIRLQISRLRAAGKTVASLGLGYAEPQAAQLTFACEPASYDGDIRKDALIVSAPALAAERCDQATRRTADVLIRRAGKEGGGLSGILHATGTARAISFRMMLTMQYLLVAQLLRVVLVVLPLLFGWQTLSAPLLLISGVWVDLAYVLICALHDSRPEVLGDAPDYTRFFKWPLRSRPDWVCATVVCGMFTTLAGWILQRIGVAPMNRGLALYMFLGLLFAQSCLLFCLLRTTGRRRGHGYGQSALLLTFLTLAALLLPILLVPPIAKWFSASGLSVVVLIAALFAPLYLLGSYFISQTYRKKLVRALRYYFRGISRKFRKRRPPSE